MLALLHSLLGGKVITKETLKNGLPRSVPIDPATVEALRVHRKRQAQAQLAAHKWHDSGLVFTNRNGGGLSPSGYIYDEWKKICAAAGVSYLTPHGLRHTHATWLLVRRVAPDATAGGIRRTA